MSWRIGVHHNTGYHYRAKVTSSYNEARITPLSTPDQLVIEASVRSSPATGLFRYWDYWGTLVDAFDIHVPHTELAITGNSVVETSAPNPPPAPVEWGALATDDLRDRFAELLVPTRYVPFDAEVAAEARSLAATMTPAEACHAAVAWTRANLTYQKGATTVTTSASEALRQGVGVCQDFAHLTLGILRSMGIPARYASGYLHPDPDAEVGTVLAGESHAWVEAWVGDWMALDPTSGEAVGERHVLVGRARDYADVSPLKGIYHGGGAEALEVSVELTRLA